MKKFEIHTIYLFLLLFASGCIYILWRALFTLNLLTSPITTFWSYMLLFAEFITLIVFTNFSVLILKNHKELKEIENQIDKSITITPGVDIFICTYNEDIDILAPTIIGAKNISYENKKVYILDDGHRCEIKDLARELEVNYITRDSNIGYKAGNINNALKQTNGELIVIFDADHTPYSNFLEETVQYFQVKNLALVQTPQFFGNLDAIQKNLEIPQYLSNEQDMFYKIIEPALNEYSSVFCGGTNIVIRRSALETVGNFPESTVTEDSLLGLIFHANKYDVYYYDKALAIGLAADNIEDYINQRKRWAKGNLQILKNPSNWKYFKQLNNIQKFFYTTSTLYFLSPIIRFILLLTPVLFLLFDISAILVIFYQIFLFQIFYFILKYLYLLTDRVKPANILLADIYDMVISIFTFGTIVKTIILPRKFQDIKFHVTNKNTQKAQKKISYKITIWAIIFVLILAEIQGLLDIYFKDVYSYPAVIVNLIWNSINMFSLLICTKVVDEKPEKRSYIRINISNKTGTIIDCNNSEHDIMVNDISRSGIKFVIKDEINTKGCDLKVTVGTLSKIIKVVNKRFDTLRAFFISPIKLKQINKYTLTQLEKFIKFSFKKK